MLQNHGLILKVRRKLNHNEMELLSPLWTSLKRFNYGLFMALFARLLMPTIYLTFRVSILGSLPDSGSLSIASQLAWVSVLLEIIDETLLLPLYNCLGTSLNDPVQTRNKVKTGLVVASGVYAASTAIISASAESLVAAMAQDIALRSQTVAYVRVELVSIVFASLAKLLMLVMVMLEWNAMLYLTLALQMVSSMTLDYVLVSQKAASLGVLGVAYSSVGTNALVLVASLAIVWAKLGMTVRGDWLSGYNFAWTRQWSRIGIYSGLDSLVRNAIYMVVVLRAMNTLESQDSYWVANAFVWQWLLLLALPLADMIKQDVAYSLSDPSLQLGHWHKLGAYFFFSAATWMVWAATSPAWPWIIRDVMKAPDPGQVLGIIHQLVPYYAAFTIGLIFTGVFYAFGRTELLLAKAILGNMLLVSLFLLMTNDIIDNTVTVVGHIFGTGLAFGAVTSTAMYYIFVIRRRSSI